MTRPAGRAALPVRIERLLPTATTAVAADAKGPAAKSAVAPVLRATKADAILVPTHAATDATPAPGIADL